MSGSSPNPGTADYATLYTLALRAFDHNRYVLAADPDPVRLFPGSLAPTFPSEVPLPPGARLFGTFILGHRMSVFCDADLAPDEVLAFYRERLPPLGWTPVEPQGRAQGGFVHHLPRTLATPDTFFCRGPKGPGLIVNANGGAPTEVGLHLIHYERPEESPCAPRPARQERFPETYERLLPALYPPQGARQEGGGAGGGSRERWTTSATVEPVTLAAASLGQHYDSQLQEAGWTLTEQGAAPPAAWSYWTMRDEKGHPYSASFFALRSAARPKRYHLMLYLEATLPERGG
jgi:hypothetical protein